MNWDNYIQPLGWTLLHFLWQGAVIAAMYVLTRYLLRTRSAQARYIAGCLALAAMAIAPLVTFQMQTGQRTVFAPAFRAVTPIPVASSQSSPSPVASAREQLPLQSGGAIVASTEISSANYRRDLERAFPWLVAIWLSGVSFLSLRLLVGWFRLQKLRTAGVTAVEEALSESVKRLRARLGVSRPVRLVQSALVQVPTVIGWLKPVILIPLSTLNGLSPSQLEAILVHELAHIRRHDFLINFLQSLLETVLFYHPAVWWVSRQVREEREHCCDDLAIEVCGDRMNYARALAALEELRQSPAELALAADGGSLISRIRRMLLPALEGTSRAPAWLSGLIVCGFVLLVVVGNLVSAQNADEPSKNPEEQTVLQAVKEISKGNFSKLEILGEMSEKAYAEFRKSDDRTVFEPYRGAFAFLGLEAGSGNTNAAEGLLRAAGMKYLAGQATQGLGIAAALGNEVALNALLEHDKHKILLSSAVGALGPAADANNQKAVEFLARVIRDPNAKPLHYMAAGGLNEAAAYGNETAIDALIHLSMGGEAEARVVLDGITRAANSGNAKAEAVLRKLRMASLLQFRLVAKEKIPGETEELVQPASKGNESKLHVHKEVFLDESHLRSAQATTSPINPKRHEIDIKLNPAGTRIFAALTKENIGKQIAVVYGGQLLMAPVIQSEITAGQLQITGNFTAGEAEMLAASLNMAAEAQKLTPLKAPEAVTAPITFISLKTNNNVFRFTWKLIPTKPVLRSMLMMSKENGMPAGYWGSSEETVADQDQLRPAEIVLEVEPQAKSAIYRMIEITSTGTNSNTKVIPAPEKAALLMLYETKPSEVNNQEHSALWHGVWIKGDETVSTESFTVAVYTTTNRGAISRNPDHQNIRLPSPGKDLLVEFKGSQRPSGKPGREVTAFSVRDGHVTRASREESLNMLRSLLNLVQSASVHTTSPGLVQRWAEALTSSNYVNVQIGGNVSQVLPAGPNNALSLVDISEILLPLPRGSWPSQIFVKQGATILGFSKYNPELLKTIVSQRGIYLQTVAPYSSLFSSEATGKAEKRSAAFDSNGPFAWQSEGEYMPPNFVRFFPDDREGGMALDDLWLAADKDKRDDEEILQKVRNGLRHTRQHRTVILRWIGNRYIWGESPQDPRAIEILYHAAECNGPNADPYGTRHYAVYFGLSVVSVKTPAILRTLADLAMRVDDPNDLDRIAWGCASQRQDLAQIFGTAPAIE